MKPSTARRDYLVEAAVLLIVARLAVRLLPSAWLFAWADRSPRQTRRFCGDTIDWVCWSVETAGTNRWINAVCLPRALVAQTMLRRRGIASRLCLGLVRRDNVLVAHAWIEVGHRMIVGGATARGFAKIAEFGKEGA